MLTDFFDYETNIIKKPSKKIRKVDWNSINPKIYWKFKDTDPNTPIFFIKSYDHATKAHSNEIVKVVFQPKIFCPFNDCAIPVQPSTYLQEFFEDDIYAYWIAILVTHYRHDHIKYYDKSWKHSAYKAKNPEYENHDEFKILVNNRAKRQIIRAIIKNNKMDKEEKSDLIQATSKLKYNDDKTLKLILTNKLEGKKHEI